jgi:hypothetical protein
MDIKMSLTPYKILESKYRNLYKKLTAVSKKQKQNCSGVEYQKVGQLYQLSNHYSYNSAL